MCEWIRPESAHASATVEQVYFLFTCIPWCIFQCVFATLLLSDELDEFNSEWTLVFTDYINNFGSLNTKCNMSDAVNGELLKAH